MPSNSPSPLAVLEPRLRSLLPADLYAHAWLDPSPATLTRVFEHLRTLQHSLHHYLPRYVAESPPTPGQMRHAWQEGTLMFTDLAGFTPLLEANVGRGQEGAETLLAVLNAYFAEMIEIISKSGGNLLEFTGDALLAQFPTDQRRNDIAQAVRAGMRMQRAMARFADLDTPQGKVSLHMRIGIHAGRFLTADIGTPRRMEHVLLGACVLNAKRAEAAGQVGRVCLTEAMRERVRDHFRLEAGQPGYALVLDDLSTGQLGEYDIAPPSRRLASSMLFDRSIAGITAEIEKAVALVEPLASYLPGPVLDLLIESAARRKIPPDFPAPTVVFVNLIGLPESVDRALPGEEGGLVSSISRAFALINAATEAHSGVLKKVTYQQAGSDIVLYFGAPTGHADDTLRAASAALAIRDIVARLAPTTVGGAPVHTVCQVGLARGRAFSAEVGEPRGRREFNVLGDTVNTAARLMNRAGENQILITASVHKEIASRFECEPLEPITLKGKTSPVPVYELRAARPSDQATSAQPT